MLSAGPARRIYIATMEPLDSEMKYFSRSWLMQLGMGGADFKATRAALLNQLQGGGVRNQQRSASYGGNPTGTYSNHCMQVCGYMMRCNLCCGGGAMGMPVICCI